MLPNCISPVERLFAVMLFAVIELLTIRLSVMYVVPPIITPLLTDNELVLIDEKLALDGNRASFVALITLFKILMFVPATSKGWTSGLVKLVALIFVADIFKIDILPTFICDVFFVDTFNTDTFNTGIVLLTFRFAVSIVSVVILAGLKMVVVKLLIVPFTALIFVHDIFPLVIVVSIPTFALAIDCPARGT